MRIRKRYPTTPSPAPPPESLHHQQQSPRPNDPPIQEVPKSPPVPAPPRSDLQLTLVKGTNGWICKTDDECMQSNSSAHPVEETLPYDSKIGKLCTAANRDNRLGAGDSEGIPSSALASHLEMESTMKTSPTREAVEEYSGGMPKKRKKVDKDSAMTDGSRCSRVNGRGWKCLKPTVVGYSLCAHHSIQGRLRSKDEKQGHTVDSSSVVLLDEEPLIMLTKRNKKKTGIIKNRSISGLLAQTERQPAPPMPILGPIAIL